VAENNCFFFQWGRLECMYRSPLKLVFHALTFQFKNNWLLSNCKKKACCTSTAASRDHVYNTSAVSPFPKKLSLACHDEPQHNFRNFQHRSSSCSECFHRCSQIGMWDLPCNTGLVPRPACQTIGPCGCRWPVGSPPIYSPASLGLEVWR
jgi:hypothetical protein